MKLIFFLIVFCLITIRFYFSWTGKDRERRGLSESHMVVKSDHFIEEINYSGKFQLSDDESGFKTISPGGYFKFRLNDVKVKAQSNLRGEIEYIIFDGKNDLPLNGEGKIIVTKAIKEMIYWGYDAEGRMERVYQKGGSRALLSEIDSVKTDQIKILYMNRLFAMDSLSAENMGFIVKKVESLNSDMDKMNTLHHIMDQDSLNEENTVIMLNLGNSLGSDMDKASLYGNLIDKGLIKDSLFDRLAVLVAHMGSDMDKSNLYKKMLDTNPICENQWIILISQSASLGSDMDKANLLSEIAKKMPKTEPIKAAYVKAAKTIGNDNDYGRIMRALE